MPVNHSDVISIFVTMPLELFEGYKNRGNYAAHVFALLILYNFDF